MATLQVSHFLSASSSSSSSSSSPCPVTLSSCKSIAFTAKFSRYATVSLHRRRRIAGVFEVGKEDTEVRVDAVEDLSANAQLEQADPPCVEYVRQIQRVLELLRKNREMLFSEILMIEDPREVERRRLLGIEDPDTPTREDLVEALKQVNEGKVPENRFALRMLAEEMVEAPKKKHATSLYAKPTDTEIDPKEAAKRLNIDWDSAAEIEEAEVNDGTRVTPAVGCGAPYLVTAFPVIVGISVVLIVFYNSLQ
ncbi:hypothetical protein SLA2020_526770 [Shorea laevis]